MVCVAVSLSVLVLVVSMPSVSVLSSKAVTLSSISSKTISSKSSVVSHTDSVDVIVVMKFRLVVVGELFVVARVVVVVAGFFVDDTRLGCVLGALVGTGLVGIITG